VHIAPTEFTHPSYPGGVVRGSTGNRRFQSEDLSVDQVALSYILVALQWPLGSLH